MNDTIYFKGTIEKEIIIRNKLFNDIRMKWEYQPKNIKSNVFIFHLKRSVGKEKVYFKNEKLLLKKNQLIPCNYWGYFRITGDHYYKKTKE